MLQYFDTLQDTAGNALVGATMQVLLFPSLAPAPIYSTNGTGSPITNSTVVADITGQVSFYVPDGYYQLNYSYQNTIYKQRAPVSMHDGLANLNFAFNPNQVYGSPNDNISDATNSWISLIGGNISGIAQANPGDGVISPFHLYISGDTVDTTTLGTSLLRMLAVELGVQAGHSGVRSGIYTSVQVVGAPFTVPASGKGHEGIEALCFVNANLLGTGVSFSTYQGGCYGGNHTARIGPNGTFIAVLNGHEFDIAIQSGGSVASKYGSSIVKEAIDTSQGVYSDVAHATFDQNGYTSNNIPAPNLVSGKSYKITSQGTSDFTLVGSPNNTVGTFFTATGPTPGTGIVQGELPPWGVGYGAGGYSSQWPFDATSTIIYAYQRTTGSPAAMPATAMQANAGYKISVVGSTNFTLVGSPNNNVGTIFIATGPATGTGTVIRGQSVANVGLDYTNVLFKTNAIQTQGFQVGPAGQVGINGATAQASLAGWGTPVGNAVINNYNITDAGGANSNTNKAVAQILVTLKAFGLLAA